MSVAAATEEQNHEKVYGKDDQYLTSSKLSRVLESILIIYNISEENKYIEVNRNI